MFPKNYCESWRYQDQPVEPPETLVEAAFLIMLRKGNLNLLSANPTKWSNTPTQLIGNIL